MSDVTRLLEAAASGDRKAAAELLPRLVVRRRAANRFPRRSNPRSRGERCRIESSPPMQRSNPMRPSTIANLAVPPATLVVSVLAALTFPPAAAAWQAAPGCEGAQGARALKAEFRQDFRSHHYDP